MTKVSYTVGNENFIDYTRAVAHAEKTGEVVTRHYEPIAEQYSGPNPNHKRPVARLREE